MLTLSTKTLEDKYPHQKLWNLKEQSLIISRFEWVQISLKSKHWRALLHRVYRNNIICLQCTTKSTVFCCFNILGDILLLSRYYFWKTNTLQTPLHVKKKREKKDNFKNPNIFTLHQAWRIFCFFGGSFYYCSHYFGAALSVIFFLLKVVPIICLFGNFHGIPCEHRELEWTKQV